MPQIGETKNGFELGKGRDLTDKYRKYIYDKCPKCGTEFWRYPKYVGKPCNHCKGLVGREHHNWKGGRWIDTWGYVNVNIENDEFYRPTSFKGIIREHRYVMAKHLGRNLHPWEIVHHKNGVKDDNRLENLELSNRLDHMSSHNKGYKDGFLKGLKDGRNKHIKELEGLIVQLKKENNDYRNNCSK